MMMLKIIRSGGLLLAYLATSVSVALAHEGHGHTAVGEGNTAKHYLTEPLHLAQIVGLIAIAAIVAWLAYRWRTARSPSNKIAA